MTIATTSEGLSAEDALTLRRAARVLIGLEEHLLAREISDIADDNGARDLCEACTELGTHFDSEGVPLCEKHYLSLLREQHPDRAEGGAS